MTVATRPAKGLYTPDMLALAMTLADFPPRPDLPLAGAAHSRTCGSRITLTLSVDGAGRIESLGIAPQACAVGQAAAALFAQAAPGKDRAALATARAEISAWLAGNSPMPDWPGLHRIAAAQATPARHAAILLAWDAALTALDQATKIPTGDQ